MIWYCSFLQRISRHRGRLGPKSLRHDRKFVLSFTRGYDLSHWFDNHRNGHSLLICISKAYPDHIQVLHRSWPSLQCQQPYCAGSKPLKNASKLANLCGNVQIFPAVPSTELLTSVSSFPFHHNIWNALSFSPTHRFVSDLWGRGGVAVACTATFYVHGVSFSVIANAQVVIHQ